MYVLDINLTEVMYGYRVRSCSWITNLDHYYMMNFLSKRLYKVQKQRLQYYKGINLPFSKEHKIDTIIFIAK